jgi:uncharacterized protein YndB with AHSA1/START domain
MSDRRGILPIRRLVTVGCPVGQAFSLFTEGFVEWWPSDYTWSGGKLETIAIEPRAGGRCFEIGPHGFHCDWGRVLLWEPPIRIVFTCQIRPDRVPEPDPDRASEVEVQFSAEGASETKVELEHHAFGRHGEGGEAYRAGMASREGWGFILERFVEFCSNR